MLDVQELRKSYGGVRALDGFTLRVRPGEIVGLVGPNGAGKTTFAHVVAGLVVPDGGTVTVLGDAPGRARGRVGIAPQQLGLYPTATARETLRLFGGLAGLRGRRLTAAIDRTAADLRLAEVLDRRVGGLSGGQQRRVQAAVALLPEPALLLLDEPTAGVDPETRSALLDAVRDRARAGAAVVYTTHYLPEIVILGASVAVTRAGRVIARGPAAELLQDVPAEVVTDVG